MDQNINERLVALEVPLAHVPLEEAPPVRSDTAYYVHGDLAIYRTSRVGVWAVVKGAKETLVPASPVAEPDEILEAGELLKGSLAREVEAEARRHVDVLDHPEQPREQEQQGVKAAAVEVATQEGEGGAAQTPKSAKGGSRGKAG
jgi:hypothetical protein